MTENTMIDIIARMQANLCESAEAIKLAATAHADMTRLVGEAIELVTAPVHTTATLVAEAVSAPTMCPPSNLVWGTAKSHNLHAGDTLMYGGTDRKAPKNVHHAGVLSRDTRGLKITLTGTDTATSVGGTATRFWAEKLTPMSAPLQEELPTVNAFEQAVQTHANGTVTLEQAANMVDAGANPWKVKVISSTTGKPVPYAKVRRAINAATKAEGKPEGAKVAPVQADVKTTTAKEAREALSPVNKAMSKLMGKYTPEQWAGRYADKALLKAALAQVSADERTAVKPFLAGAIAKASK